MISDSGVIICDSCGDKSEMENPFFVTVDNYHLCPICAWAIKFGSDKGITEKVVENILGEG